MRRPFLCVFCIFPYWSIYTNFPDFELPASKGISGCLTVYRLGIVLRIWLWLREFYSKELVSFFSLLMKVFPSFMSCLKGCRCAMGHITQYIFYLFSSASSLLVAYRWHHAGPDYLSSLTATQPILQALEQVSSYLS